MNRTVPMIIFKRFPEAKVIFLDAKANVFIIKIKDTYGGSGGGTGDELRYIKIGKRKGKSVIVMNRLLGHGYLGGFELVR